MVCVCVCVCACVCVCVRERERERERERDCPGLFVLRVHVTCGEILKCVTVSILILHLKIFIILIPGCQCH